jgi:aspartate-semialdehyde dehydrogenase
VYKVAIVGATGAVGQELLKVLAHREFPIARLVALASPRSAGRTVSTAMGVLTIREVTANTFDDIDFAFFSAGAQRSRDFVPVARQAGATVIDNSSAFRMDPQVPLVVPEVNPEALQNHGGLIANPNCVAAILTVAIAPLRVLGTFQRLVVSTYQSASGAGALAMEDLKKQTRCALEGQPVVPRVLAHPYAFNLFSHDSEVEDNGYNGEENKVTQETKKILSTPDLGISITCVRVPILRAHTVSINIEFQSPVAVQQAREILAAAPGIRLADDPERNHFPMPSDATGKEDILVGRVRADPSNPHALNLLVCGDQLLKGAALNAVQIAEALII